MPDGDFTGAHLNGSYFPLSDLSHAILNGATLDGSHLDLAVLAGAQVNSQTTFAGAASAMRLTATINCEPPISIRQSSMETHLASEI
jgi:uncharacterized protein YjbI with pentapeptide repeats